MSRAGDLDTTFGIGGKVITDISGNKDDIAWSVVIDNSNNIIVAGETNYDFAIARYTSLGILDTTFGSNRNGKVITDISGNKDDYAFSVVIDNSNNIIVAGITLSGTNNNYDFVLARYTSNGSLDQNFGNGGKVITDFGSNDDAYSVVIDNSNNIIVAGYTYTNNYDFALARYNSLGILDTTFGSNGNGKVITDISGNKYDEARSVVIDNSNNIIVAGYTLSSTENFDFVLARYTSNGSLDTTFGNGNGKVTTDFGGNSDDKAYSVVIDKNNKIIVAGFTLSTTNNSDYDFVLARYTSNGNLDPTFGSNGNGIVITDISGNKYDEALSVVIDENNKIIVAGISYNDTSNYDFVLARYLNEAPPMLIHMPLPISNICFIGKTPIRTDQGIIAIQKIISGKHTIRNKEIIAITKTITEDKYLICFEKNAISKNIPSERTIVSKNHLIFHKGKMIKAKDFIKENEKVSKIKYKGEILYNVLLTEYDKMVVNNLICETLNPKNMIAKLYTFLSDYNYNIEEQSQIIKKYNMEIMSL